jgi:hypothetical protein
MSLVNRRLRQWGRYVPRETGHRTDVWVNDFYVEDEPLEDVLAAYEVAEKGLTSPRKGGRHRRQR